MGAELTQCDAITVQPDPSRADQACFAPKQMTQSLCVSSPIIKWGHGEAQALKALLLLLAIIYLNSKDKQTNSYLFTQKQQTKRLPEDKESDYVLCRCPFIDMLVRQ